MLDVQLFVFFFQAEDGIRDIGVTGVQTCALPILQSELVDTEDKIQAARRFYNGGVRDLNTKIKTFPNTLFVRRLGFTERDFFEVDEPAAIAEPPRVQF